MKKTFLLLLTICIILSSLTIPSMETSAETYNNLEYSIIGGVIAITGGKPVNGVLTIPDRINNVRVVAVNGYAFMDNIDIVKVVLPSTIESLAIGAFKNCESLTDINLPEGLLYISNETFAGCYNLKTLSIPSSVRTINSNSFNDCLGLIDINVNSSNSNFSSENGILYDKTKYTLKHIPSGKSGMVALPDSLSEIDSFGISNLPYVTGFSMSLSNNKYSIDNGVLYNKDKTILVRCPQTRTSQFVIPDGITAVWKYAFSKCSKLNSVIFPDSVIALSDYSFSRCNSLTYIDLNKVSRFGYSPFKSCINLETVTIRTEIEYMSYDNSDVSSFSSDPFADCANLRRAFVLCNANNYIYNLFQTCESTMRVFYDQNMTGWDQLFMFKTTIPFDLTKKHKVTYMPNGATSGAVPIDIIEYDFDDFYTVMENTGNLQKGESEFLGWNTNTDGTSVDHFAGDMFTIDGDDIVLYAMWEDDWSYGESKSIEINGLTWHYTERGTSWCSVDGVSPAIDTINIPKEIASRKVMSISQYAFANESEITWVIIPDGVTTINDYAFLGAEKLSGVSIPSSIAHISPTAFNSCTNLNAFSGDYGNAYYSCYGNILYDKYKTKLIKIPATCEPFISFPMSIQTISSYAVSDFKNGSTFIIPESATTIEDFAFLNSTTPSIVKIPKNVSSIGETSFMGCEEISEFKVDKRNNGYSSREGILLNKSQTSFIQCPALKGPTVIIPDTVTSIGSAALFDCFNAKTFQVGAANTSFSSADGILYNKLKTGLIQCPILKTGAITIPNTVVNIKELAFSMCTGLTSVLFPSGLKSIGAASFMLCTSLTTVTLPASVTSIGDNAFYICDSLSKAYFSGNAPQMGMGVFDYCADNFKIYYLSTKSGFTTPYWLDDKYPCTSIPGTYTVTFNSNGGTAITTKTVTFNTKSAAPSVNPTRSGYIFSGWYTSSAFTTPVSFDTLILANTTLYAKWIASATAGLKVASGGYNALKLTWTATSGATNYEIYRATSATGAYTLVTTTLATAGSSYTNTGLSFNTTYYYKVRAYSLYSSVKTYSGYSSVASAKTLPLAPASVVASSPSYNSIKLSWAAVPGANGYSVYRSTSATGTFTLISTVTTAYYTNASLTPGATYYYKVSAYRLVGTTKVYGPQCAAVSKRVVPATITNLTAVRYSSTSIKLTWGGISGASGYEIYRSTAASGTYTLLKAQTLLTYTNTALKTGTTYYYKVRSYRLVGTTKVYSDFSSVKNAKP